MVLTILNDPTPVWVILLLSMVLVRKKDIRKRNQSHARTGTLSWGAKMRIWHFFVVCFKISDMCSLWGQPSSYNGPAILVSTADPSTF